LTTHPSITVFTKKRRRRATWVQRFRVRRVARAALYGRAAGEVSDAADSAGADTAAVVDSGAAGCVVAAAAGPALPPPATPGTEISKSFGQSLPVTKSRSCAAS
jgi:hypothetical protein